MAARGGGDELAVIAEVGINAPAVDEAEGLGQRPVAAIGRPVAVGPSPRRADGAMYSAKKAGKGRVAVLPLEAVDLADLRRSRLDVTGRLAVIWGKR